MLNVQSDKKLPRVYLAGRVVGLAPDAVGMEFGRWRVMSTVVLRSRERYGKLSVLCTCTGCTKTKWVQLLTLEGGASTQCQSCSAAEQGAFSHERAQAKKDF